MKRHHFLISAVFLVGILIGLSATLPDDNRITSYIIDTQKQDVQLYWKDDSGTILKSIQNLKTFVESKNGKLVFAMNAGMYMQDNTPLGLYIENGKQHTKLNTQSAASGNFYLKPNGIFYITTDNKAVVCKIEDFKDDGKIQYATQSGPMLVIDGELHSAFKQGSTNLNLRNGVGILPDGKVVFAISKTEINFYDFATYFKDLGCKNALYLDGFVSRMYLPEKDWTQLDGNFGVMIGVVDRNDE